MKLPYFDWRDLAFGWKEKQPSGCTFVYLSWSARCAVCGKFNWRNWKRYHPACEAQVERWIQQ